MTPQVVGVQGPAAEQQVDALVVSARPADGGFELDASARSVDEALDGALSEHLERASFKAGEGQVVVVPTFGRAQARLVAVAGLGAGDGTPAYRRAAGAAARRLFDATEIAFAIEGADAAPVVEGALLGTYRFTEYRSDPKTSKVQRVLVVGGDPDSIEHGLAVAEATATARDLINEPADSLPPAELAARAEAVASAAGLHAEVLDEDALTERGMNGILSVGKGSTFPPRLIMLHHERPDAARRIALVGKGVTFDSGGLSLKDARNMEQMKTDMAGGAAVIGAMQAIARLGLDIDVRAYVPAVENMPSGRAIKPGDVIRHYGGLTVEVLNTDAEGRLILGDALALASEASPAAIVDVATLTGSIMVALGRSVTGLFTNDDDLADALLAAAAEAGEDMWQMPLHRAYMKDLDSEIADMKNTGGRYGGSITAALFLSRFVADGIPWAHLDIAGTGRNESDEDLGPKGGSGVATRTLIGWVASQAGA